MVDLLNDINRLKKILNLVEKQLANCLTSFSFSEIISFN